MTTLLTALPPAPSRSQNPSAFAVSADAFLSALPGMVAQFNIVANEVNDNANKASQAASSAIAVAGASNWVSGQSYSQGAAAVSLLDFQTYRRKVAGSGTTDPKNDTTNWALLNPLPGALTMFMYNTFGDF